MSYVNFNKSFKALTAFLSWIIINKLDINQKFPFRKLVKNTKIYIKLRTLIQFILNHNCNYYFNMQKKMRNDKIEKILLFKRLNISSDIQLQMLIYYYYYYYYYCILTQYI